MFNLFFQNSETPDAYQEENKSYMILLNSIKIDYIGLKSQQKQEEENLDQHLHREEQEPTNCAEMPQ